MLYIGNHTSSSRGYLAMGKQMLANGGNTFAFFTRNPRGGTVSYTHLHGENFQSEQSLEVRIPQMI